MNEFSMFLGFFQKAIKKTVTTPLALLFAILMTLSSVEYLLLFLGEGNALQTGTVDVAAIIKNRPSFFLLIPLIIGLATFFKTSLILSLKEKKAELLPVLKRAARSLWKLSLLEVGALLLFFIMLLVLLTPGFLTSGNPLLSKNLVFLGLAIFIPISIVIVFIEIYAFFFITLSQTSLRAGVELGYSLFMKRAATSIVFGILSLLLFIPFFFLIALLRDALTNEAGQFSRMTTIVSNFPFLLLQAGFLIIQKSAWLSFFHFIATPKEPEAVATDQALQKNENVVQKEVPETI